MEDKELEPEVKDTEVKKEEGAKDELEKLKAIVKSPEQIEIIKLMEEDRTFVAVRGIMAAKNKIEEIRTVKDTAVRKVRAMTPDARVSIIEARAKALDAEAVGKLDMKNEENWKKIQECYTFDDGTVLHFTNEPEIKDVKFREMHRDYLLYLKSIQDETEKFDVYEAKLTKEIDDEIAKFGELLGEEEADKLRNYADFADYYRQWITNVLQRDDISPLARQKLEEIVKSDNAGISLDFLIKEIQDLIGRKGNASSLLFGYRNNYVEVATKAEKILTTKFAQYKYETAMTKFFDFEKRFFPEYEKYNNLFMFILFRYIKANYEKFDSNWMITIGEILTQLGFLTKPETDRPPCSKEFEEAFRTVMSLVINH